jgi:2-amino-4-hydroxy-6-hydroxymethyldihydropteridine diphosphokinase
MSEIVYLSLGSNMGDRQTNLQDAIALLETVGHVVRKSSFYETEPVEFTRQAWFLNCAAAIETETAPEKLMAELLEIEQDLGRRRTRRKGPRTIDIDILLFGDRVLSLPGLIVPHPAMHERRFVLEPLAEIAPQARHPVLKKTIGELLASLPAGQVVRKLEEKRSGGG